MPATVNDPKELLVQQLSDVLGAERAIERMLPKLRKETTDEKLAGRFEQHIEETRRHAKNLEEAFKALGVKPRAHRCPGIEGIRAEHEEHAPKDGSPQLRDIFVLTSVARTEHYEMAAYEPLVTLAKAMGEGKLMNLLERNLKDERAMLSDARAALRRLAGKAAKQAT